MPLNEAPEIAIKNEEFDQQVEKLGFKLSLSNLSDEQSNFKFELLKPYPNKVLFDELNTMFVRRPSYKILEKCFRVLFEYGFIYLLAPGSQYSLDGSSTYCYENETEQSVKMKADNENFNDLISECPSAYNVILETILFVKNELRQGFLGERQRKLLECFVKELLMHQNAFVKFLLEYAPEKSNELKGTLPQKPQASKKRASVLFNKLNSQWRKKRSLSTSKLPDIYKQKKVRKLSLSKAPQPMLFEYNQKRPIDDTLEKENYPDTLPVKMALVKPR